MIKKLPLIIAFAVSFNFAFSQAKDTFNVTFRISLKGSNRTINSNGLRVTGALNSAGLNNWDPAGAKPMTLLTPVSDSIYGITIKIARDVNQRTDAGTSIDLIPFKFINGNNWGNGTTDPTEDERGLDGSACAISGGNRIFSTVGKKSGDVIVLPAYVFNTCKTVNATGTNDLTTVKSLNISPNPVNDIATLSFTNLSNVNHTLKIMSLTGQVMRTYAPTTSEQFKIQTSDLAKGIYFARLTNEQGEASTLKFIAQ